jgi:2,4-dienoyl-CoA reductase-like NADH-dependent reductase (Old Yellow Enzyme family)/thioredoxin reductase
VSDLALPGARAVDARHESLFRPLTVGPLELPNRIVMAPMGTGLDDGGLMTEAIVEYYRRRAAGGTGTITVEACLVDPRTDGPEPRLYGPQHVGGMTRVVEAVRAEGSVVGVQLLHPGRQAAMGRLYAPSAIRVNSFLGEPEALTIAGIAEIVEYFAAAAELAEVSGFDFVEIHGAHGYLPSDFLSPAANQRDDGYGGDLEGRARFGREVVRAIRARAPDLPVFYRISGDEGVPGGITIDDAVQMSRWLVEDGVACISVSGGSWRSLELTLAPMFLPRGRLVGLAQAVRDAVEAPVIAVGRLDDPDLAARVVAEGAADLVAVGRGLLADADWAAKIREGRAPDVRPCIACNACVELVGPGGEVRCAVNPEVGREHRWAPQPVARPRRIAVIGSGPAGLEAARISRERGHHVTLWERDHRLGGKLEAAASAPSKADVLRFRDYEEALLERLGVEIRLGVEATAPLLLAEGYDAVIVATGATAIVPPVPGVDRPHVHDAQAFLRGDVSVARGERVVVIGGSATGCETAELLADADIDVTIVEMLPAIGRGIEGITRRLLLRELCVRGVDVLVQSRVTKIEHDRVLFERADGGLGAVEADHVALAVGWRPLGDVLATELADRHVIVVGDADRPADFVAAVNAGADAGLSV